MFMSMALGICGFSYIIVITCVYFWKKKPNEDGNLAPFYYRILLILLVLLGFLEVTCIITMNYREQIPVINEVLCRFHILADIIWIAIFLVYIYCATRKPLPFEETIKVKRILTIIFIVVVSACYLFTCTQEVTFHTAINPNYYVVGGPALYLVYGIAGVGVAITIYALIKARKQFSNNLMQPIIYFSILFGIMAALEFIFFDYRINYIYFLFCYCASGMFFTVESQDSKLLVQMEKTKTEAEVANKAKTEFLSNVSHEIRTPMNTIMGFSQALLEEKNLTEEIVKRDATSIKAASSNLLVLINNILDISRIESGKELLDEKEYKLDDLLYEVNSVINSKINKEVVSFKINIDENIPSKFYGDSGKIYKIILCTLTNAIEHTNYGAVNLDLGGAYDGENYKLSLLISNTGHEMKAEDFTKNFEDFAELSDNTKNTIDSTKLGLIVSKRLVSMLNGTIDFKNEKGKGTRYIISIDQKVIDDTKIGNIFADGKASINSDAIDCKGKKVLIVDDNKVNIKLAWRLLSQFNFDIASADSGKQCIDMVKMDKYDIIFLDHMMPEMDGIETVHSLRESGCSAPIIALTANSYTGLRESYIKEGFTDYLSKPISYKELNKLLKSIFGK